MANVYAVKSGNWSDTTVWNTGALPTTADDVYSNNFTVTVDQNITVLSLRNGAATPIVAGGTFALADGITATVTTGFISSTGTLARITGSDSATIIGNITSGNGIGINISQSANLTITGSITGGGINAYAINNSSTGTLNLIGTATGGNNSGGNSIFKRNTGVVNIIGDVISGTNAASSIVNSSGNTTYRILGNLFSNGVAAYNDVITSTAAALLVITGSVYGPNVTSTLPTINISSAATVIISGSIFAGTYSPAIESDLTTGNLFATGPFYNINGRNAVFARNIQLISGSTTTWTFDTETYAEQRTLYSQNWPGNFPSASNVRQGIIFGDTNQFTGTVAIPPTGSVLKGVPVDNTTGSASFDTQSVWGINTNNLTTTGSLGARLRNTATVATDGAAIASKGNL
jgi:hypothetical protein